MKQLKGLALFLVMAALVVFATACGGTEEAAPNEENNTDGATEEQPKEEPQEELEGAVIVDGSGTVFPLMARIAEEYMTVEEENVSVQVGRAGSSAGFKKFIAGETDFSDASRAIKDKEIAQLEEQGLKMGEDVMEIKLAYDGLTMVIHPENTWAEELTKDQIVNMYLSGKFNAEDKVLWSDVVEGAPDEEIKFYGPNENHGTYEFFFEKILDEQEMVTTANLQQEYSTLVDLVSKDENAIAFFGYGYYEKNTDKIKAVKVDFGEGPVAPSLETIGEDLAYAGFTRPVYTYVNLNYAAEKPQVLDYAYYVLEAAPQFAGETGFAPMPQAIFDEYKTQLDAVK